MAFTNGRARWPAPRLDIAMLDPPQAAVVAAHAARDPVAETGGQFNVDGGADYSASGIFAGAK